MLRGERRIHFSKESDSRRRELLARLCDHGLGDELHRLVFESRNAGDVDDQRQLIDLHRTWRFPDHATYEHLRPHEEPLLWVADAIAWAHRAGGDWPRRIAPMVRIVRQHEV